MSSAATSPEQLSLDSVRPEKPPLVAFGKFVKPEMYDVFGDYDLSNLSDTEKVWMTADRIGEALFRPPRNERALIVDSIGLNPYEYGILARSPMGLARHALSHVLQDNDLDDERMAASQRGQVHILESKRDPMSEHVEKLRAARHDVQALHGEAKKPGYAHKTDMWMKEHLSTAWLEFQTMLDVMRVQRGWNDETSGRAQAALINYLSQGSQRDRVKHWKEMIELSENYLRARIILFSGRIREIDNKLSSTGDEQVPEQAS